ncbi:MAG: aroK [Anaerophaga sp.]|nr:aroK [Anaerophaga sp.]
MAEPIYLTGFMGSGKTTFGRMLADALNRDFLDLDHLIEKQEGASVSELFSKYEEDGFRSIEHNILLSTKDRTNAIIATGGGAPCFQDNMDFMNRHGLTIYLKVSPEALAKRLLPSRDHRPLIAGKSETELLNFIRAKLAERAPWYNKAQIIADTSGLSIQDTLRIVIKALELH